MKKLKIINYVMMGLAIVLMTACQKEDQIIINGEIINQFTLNGEKHELENGFLEEWQSNITDAYCFDVYLTSKGITYDQMEEKYVGLGNYIYIDFETESADRIDAGRYKYSDEGGPFTFVDGEIGIDFDFGEFVSEEKAIEGGDITITYEGNEMIALFSLELEDGNTIDGTYQGKLIKVF